jgi:3-hydroxybutyryl-CoA dehydrogenase
MKILIIGDDINLAEAQKKFGSSHVYTHTPDHRDCQKQLSDHDLVFDFIPHKDRDAVKIFFDQEKTIFINACKVSLSELATGKQGKQQCNVFGFNGIPTLLDRSVLEVSLLGTTDEEKLKSICKDLGTPYLRVDDRVGMATPRVIAMIINEAYYTVQEGTASRADIDVAMKLGTNYPHGPFEWCNRIGIAHVYELLSALYDDTKDERYKICPLLKKEYLSVR